MKHKMLCRRVWRGTVTGLLVAALALGSAGVASAADVNNGNFSNGLTGWTQVNSGNGGWQAVTFTGSTGILVNGFTIPKPPDTSSAAATYQGGPGSHMLYQDITLEPGMSHNLTFDYRWQNSAGAFFTPASLSHLVSPNQQARVDVMKTSAATTSVAASDVLLPVVATTPSSSRTIPWTRKTVDLSEFAGQTVRLRFAEVDNQSFFSFDATNISIDSRSLNTAPSIEVAGVVHDGTYEFGAVPAATCAASDTEDGPSNPTASLSEITGARSAAGLGSQTATCTYTDQSGLSGTATATYSIVDTTAPVLTIPADQAETATSAEGATVTYTAPSAVDTVDGDVTPDCNHSSGETFPLGLTTVTCTATDVEGNKAAKSFKVNVTYSYSGVRPPINADGSSIFKAGSTIPVKFALTGASNGIANAGASLAYTKISNGIEGTTVEATSTSSATTGSLFRYDATSQQYIFNLSSKDLASGTYRLNLVLGDGVTRSVLISLK